MPDGYGRCAVPWLPALSVPDRTESVIGRSAQAKAEQVDRVRRGTLDVLAAQRSERHPEREGALGADTAIQTVPTGLSGVPPEGPATPVVAMPYMAPVARRTPSAICSATGRLTGSEALQIAPVYAEQRALHVVRVCYHAAPKVVRGAGRAVKRRAMLPPVHDSAVATVAPRARSRSPVTLSSETSPYPTMP